MSVKHIHFVKIIFTFLSVSSYYILGVGNYVKTRLISPKDFVRHPRYKRLVWKIHRLLCELSPYYFQLSTEGKRKFIIRLIDILPRKIFVARAGETITIEKKILVLSALIQITFGHTKYRVPKFKHVGLYPKAFYSRFLDTYVKGLTVARGHILLSWYDTLKGFYEPDDNLNLAIHEWSHAFILDHYHDPSRRMYIGLNKYKKQLLRYFEKAKNTKHLNGYLRTYGFTNQQEFFAVCVEHFFETPQDFAQEMPDAFDILSKLLNQNPLNVDLDYRLE